MRAGLLLLLIVGAACDSRFDDGPPAPEGAPSILIVSIDSLRHDHLGTYGYARDTSPAIDAIAAEGARFETALAPTSWTLPTHMTLLTALPPIGHGVIGPVNRLREEVPTLAEALSAHGYATAGFVSGPLLHSTFGFAQGFDHYDDYTAVELEKRDSHRAITSPVLHEQVTDWLDDWRDAGRPRPFFVFLHMWDVHYDYIPPPPYDELFDPNYRGSVTADDFEDNGKIRLGMDPRDLEHVIALYDGEIRYTDLYLGRILDFLREEDDLDDTIVVVTADHGEEFFEHGRKGHAHTLHEVTVRVPLIMRWPGRIPSGLVLETPVTLQDVAPTLLSLAGLPPLRESSYGERDLSPLLTDGDGALGPSVAYGDLYLNTAYLRTRTHKLITTVIGKRRQELYDLRYDPGETRNLAFDDPARADGLWERLSGWREAWNLRGNYAESADLTPELEDQLRALGYVD